MASKVALIYEDGKYTVSINGVVVETFDNIDLSIEKFNQTIKNNANASERSWEFIEESIKSLNNKNLEINSQFKTIAIGAIKYFYNTGKIFYIGENNMIPLVGGYELVKFIAKTQELQNIDNANSFIDLCKFIIENRANYRTTEDSIIVFSPALSYGSVEFNFNTKRINKGVGIQDGSFEEFKQYILNSLKR